MSVFGIEVNPARIALDKHCYESARRLCLLRLAQEPDDAEALLLLHEAYRRMGDFSAAAGIITRLRASRLGEDFTLLLLEAENFHLLANEGCYRGSREKEQGLCVDEYLDKYRGLSEAALARAAGLADTPQRRAAHEASLALCGRGAAPVARDKHPVSAEAVEEGCGSVSGILRTADGQPLRDCLVTLGLRATVRELAPDTLAIGQMGYAPEVVDLPVMSVRTGEDGGFLFGNVPARRHEFLAVTLDDALGVHFFAHDINVFKDRDTRIEHELLPWRSAETLPVPEQFPAEMFADGVLWRRVLCETARNPFYYDFPRQELELRLPPGVPADARRLRLMHGPSGSTIPLQISGTDVVCMVELPGRSEMTLCLYCAQSNPSETLPVNTGMFEPQADGTALIDTGRSVFRIGWRAAAAPLPPLLAVKAADGVWRGCGRFYGSLASGILRQEARLVEDGAIRCGVTITYYLRGGGEYSFTLRAHRGEEYLLVDEISCAMPGSGFDFSLREFSGGRAYLHWNAENGSRHWSDLDAREREVARLQESVAWWIPPQGFACAFCPAELESRDYIGVFTRRRGEWDDREFSRICNGPGDDNRELDWPFPEMVGSTISMITAQTDAKGDAYFRFGMFEGVRKWGVLASDFAANDGRVKEISRVQHKTSSPRLQEFIRWRLDVPDTCQRPFVLADVKSLARARANAGRPGYREILDNIRAEGEGKRKNSAFSAQALLAMLDKNPAGIWRLKKEIAGVAHIRSRMTLEGRDYSDMYSPVGGRPITPWAEVYDLIVPTGVFTPQEERLSRAFLLLMGHMYMEEDLMNWRYNSRNANFEADRCDIVGVVGLVFSGNPDAQRMIEHVTALMRRSLETYCTPGSGKWYENPACYYLHALKCRMNLAYHLYKHGIYDSTGIPRLKDFLGWGPKLLTPEFPTEYNLLRDGCGEEEYALTTKARRVPPIGDHAQLGQWVGEAFALLGKCYRGRDPEFASFLKWAYEAGGKHGGYFNSLAAYFCNLEDGDFTPAPAPELASSRLEGFGAIFRRYFGRDKEFYLLFKLGPGGYRYHRTEGSIIMFANGKPLIYDGGEAGEAWRHSTLSFHETHMPLAAGHIERFAALGALEFAQGVNPKVLAPGEAVYLSDTCEHHLVEEAHRRFAERRPANSRSIICVGDEYVIMHDELDLPQDTLTHWNLQVVADTHRQAEDGYDFTFTGRFGTDLQVLLPEQRFSRQEVAQEVILDYQRSAGESFSMRHLQLSVDSPEDVIALLRPLFAERKPLGARLLRDTAGEMGGLEVFADGIADIFFLRRGGSAFECGEYAFSGSYGAILRRSEGCTLIIMDGQTLRFRDICLSVRGVAASLETGTGGSCVLRAQGTGEIEVTGLSRPVRVKLSGEKCALNLNL